jgi:hypothetical protein
MNIQDAFSKAFGTTRDKPSAQKILSRRITDGNTITSSSSGMHTLGMNTMAGSTVGIGSSKFGQTFNQPSFGSSSGSSINKPSKPFEYLDPLDQAKIIKDFLISRGVKKINEETAKALFLVSCVLKDQVLPPVKQAKKKLII